MWVTAQPLPFTLGTNKTHFLNLLSSVWDCQSKQMCSRGVTETPALTVLGPLSSQCSSLGHHGHRCRLVGHNLLFGLVACYHAAFCSTYNKKCNVYQHSAQSYLISFREKKERQQTLTNCFNNFLQKGSFTSALSLDQVSVLKTGVYTTSSHSPFNYSIWVMLQL